ncbi:unnamed protein product, partial [marine sediment metagenome]
FEFLILVNFATVFYYSKIEEIKDIPKFKGYKVYNNSTLINLVVEHISYHL